MRNGNSHYHKQRISHWIYEILIEIWTTLTYLDFARSFFSAWKQICFCSGMYKTFIWIPRNSLGRDKKKWKGEKLMTSPIRHSTFLFRVIFYQSSNISALFFVFLSSYLALSVIYKNLSRFFCWLEGKGVVEVHHIPQGTFSKEFFHPVKITFCILSCRQNYWHLTA